ncbi:FUSC family protein [Campylobacter sp. faydin G-140]|uniref:FUSC family protein n=1 Tax=Campylobacter anatolicus TaxID=2829105 RepID=UPI001B9C0933|nr:FUSC family protein [Campylobacter anatolicus]MBR8462703.1 FUSC family protein [Campylobacter anatolicus]MBR8466034.1 FUSC family protein [Campylobacter anatolicus]
MTAFFRSYDPANFYLIYSLKATFAIALNCFLGYYFFNINGAIFSVNITMGIFFLSTLECKDSHKFGFLTLYIILSIAFMPFVVPLIKLGTILALFVFIWVFLLSLTSLYNVNLHKILIATNTTGLVGFIVQSSGGIILDDAIGGLALGGVSAIIIKMGKFAKYGAFTKDSMRILLDDAYACVKVLGADDFYQQRDQMLSHIAKFKSIFATESVNLKDIKLVRNYSRAIFYLYKIEEIAYVLAPIHSSFKKIEDTRYLDEIREEILYNINELKGLFEGKSAIIKMDILNLVRSGIYKVFASSLDVLYFKFKLIKDGGEDKIEFKKAKKTTLLSVIKKINLKDETTLSALRLAFCMSAAIFISQLTKIDHGIWIAIAVMSIKQDSHKIVKISGVDNILGAFFGLALALFTIYVFSDGLGIVILSIVGIFFVYYLKQYKQIAFTTAFMFEFSLVFYMIKNDFLQLVLQRLTDIMIGFMLVFVVSLFTATKDTKQLKAKLKSSLMNFKNFIDTTLIERKGHTFSIQEIDIANAIRSYEQELWQSDISEQKRYELRQICNILNDANIDLIKLRNYLKFLNQNELMVDVSLKNDLDILSSRFEMLSRKVDNLPYYFLQNAKDKLLCNDERVQKLSTSIITKQNEIYSLLSL